MSNKLNTSRHISGQFNNELGSIRNRVMAMGGLVEQQMSSAIKAVSKRDTELAEQVIKSEDKVDAFEVNIDKECAKIIVKRQPAASDLRLVVAIIKTITDLERIGDVAERLALMCIRNAGKPQPFITHLARLGNLSLDMLGKVLDAFARGDARAAIKVYYQDKQLDESYSDLANEMTAYMREKSSFVPQGLQALLSIRDIERVGDRCKNIAECVVYLVEGKDVRHSGGKSLDKLIYGST